MRKNRTIAVIVGNNDRLREEADNLQYWLLGRGFQWVNRLNVEKATAPFTLFVDLESKTINWSATSGITTAEGNAYKVFSLHSDFLSQIFGEIRNPKFPVEHTDVQSINGDIARVYADGKVEFWDVSENKLQCTTNKDTILGIARVMGSQGGLPLVQFYYPSSTSGTKTLRYVRVTRLDDDYLQGFEIENKQDKGTFKKFILDKITSDVRLVWFTQE